MSKRPKSLLNQAKPKQKKKQSFDTADDYLAAGVDFEDAAGKWRAGDATKSMRFFQRAIEAYDQGLTVFPSSLDLAYNKARVLLEVATHPILVERLQVPLPDALRAALDAHRYALKLDPENADALFNTAQVLTSIAEEIANDDDIPGTEALKLLEEALELQARCWSIQEVKYEENLRQERLAEAGADDSNVAEEVTALEEAPDQVSADENDGDEWFTVVEPVTDDSLIDTLAAQLNTLTTFCGILSGSPESAPAATLPMIEEYSAKLVERIPILSQKKPERSRELLLSKANFTSAILEAGFRSGKLDAVTYKRELDGAFDALDLAANGSTDTLMASARSLLSFNAALAELYSNESLIRWNAITVAIQHLTTASKVQGIDQSDLATTHLLRGDGNLYLYALGLPPASHQAAISNAGQLVKNAAVFYRNASKLSSGKEEKDVAKLRGIVSEFLQQQLSQNSTFDIGAIVSASPRNPQWALEQLEDMVSEGLLPQAVGM